MADFRVSGIVTVDVSKGIRDLDKFENELNEVWASLKAVDAAIEDIDGESIRVSADADSSGIAKLREDMETLSDGEVEIELEGADAVIAELRAIDEEIDRINGHKAEVDVFLDNEKAILQAEKLNRELDAMIDEHKEIKVDVDTSGLDELRGKLRGLIPVIGTPNMMGSVIGGLALLATTLAPLTAVALGAGAGIAAGMGVAAAGVGAFGLLSIPIFKAVGEGLKEITEATKDLKGAEKLKAYEEALKGVDKWVRPVVKGVYELKEAHEQMARSIRPELVGAMTAALSLAETGLRILTPIAGEAATALEGLFKQAEKGLKGEDWSKFFNYVRENTGYFITTWGTAVGNFVTGIANMIVALDPLARFFSEGLLTMSENFKNWSSDLENNKGFQNFVNFVKQHGPLVMSVFRQLMIAMIEVGKIVAPLGVKLLQLADAGLRNFNAWVKANPEAAQFAAKIAAIALVVGPLLPMLSGMLKPLGALPGIFGAIVTKGGPLGGIFGALKGPWGFILGAGAGVALAFTGVMTAMALTVDTGKPYRDMWESIKGLWETIKQRASEFKEMLMGVYEQMKQNGTIASFQTSLKMVADGLNDILVAIKPLIPLLGPALVGSLQILAGGFRIFAFGVKQAGNNLRMFVELVGGYIQTAIKYFKGFYNTVIGGSIIPDLVRGIINWFQKLPGAIAGILANMVARAIKFFDNLKDKGINAIKNLVDRGVDRFNDMRNRVTTSVNSMRDRVNSAFDRLRDNARSRFDQIRQAIVDRVNQARERAVSSFNQLRERASSSINQLREAVSSRFNAMREAIVSRVTAARQAAIERFNSLRQGGIEAIQRLIDGVRSNLSRIRGVVTGAFAGAGTWLIGAGKSLMSGFASGIRTAGQTAINAARAIASAVARLLPGSPIKEGPLKSWNNGGAGKRLMGLLAEGIKGNPAVQQAMQQNLRSVDIPKLAVGQTMGRSWDSLNRGLANAPFGMASGITQYFYTIEVKVPIGASSAEIGKELATHIDNYHRAGGQKGKK